MDQITVTSEGKRKLEEELEYLKTVKRKEDVEAIRVARSFGDLSENSEYDEAKTEQGKTESRISELEDMLKRAVVVDDTDVKTDKVNVGNVVRVLDEDFDEEIEYTIVGSTEADPLENRISDLSPIGKAMLGAKVGDRVSFDTPGGKAHIKILAIKKKK